MKQYLITIVTPAEDADGNEYPDPKTWDWSELVGPDTFVVISTKD